MKKILSTMLMAIPLMAENDDKLVKVELTAKYSHYPGEIASAPLLTGDIKDIEDNNKSQESKNRYNIELFKGKFIFDIGENKELLLPFSNNFLGYDGPNKELVRIFKINMGMVLNYWNNYFRFSIRGALNDDCHMFSLTNKLYKNKDISYGIDIADWAGSLLVTNLNEPITDFKIEPTLGLKLKRGNRTNDSTTDGITVSYLVGALPLTYKYEILEDLEFSSCLNFKTEKAFIYTKEYATQVDFNNLDWIFIPHLLLKLKYSFLDLIKLNLPLLLAFHGEFNSLNSNKTPYRDLIKKEIKFDTCPALEAEMELSDGFSVIGGINMNIKASYNMDDAKLKWELWKFGWNLGLKYCA